MTHGYQALTEREKQTLRLLLEGHDAKSLARHFGLSVHTINERLRDARRKLSVSSSREAARLLREVEGATPDSPVDTAFGDAPDAASTPFPNRPRPVPHPRRSPVRGIGGLVMFAFAATLLLLAAPQETPVPQAGSSQATVAETGSSRAARDWLTLLDASRWQESWAATGASFRSLNTVDAWTRASERVRAPLGRMVSRTLLRDEDTPAPPNGLRVVRFRTSFANKPDAVETVSLDREGDAWKMVGVYVE